MNDGGNELFIAWKYCVLVKSEKVQTPFSLMNHAII